MLNTSKNQQGFTLVEIIVTVAIISILTTIATFTYQNQMEKARRSDGLTALTQVAQALERYYTDNNQYTTTISSLPSPASSSSVEGWYNIAVTSADLTTSYTITATATGLQSGDSTCASIVLTSANSKTPADCW